VPSGGINIDSLLGVARLEARIKQLERSMDSIRPAATIGSRAGGKPPKPTNLQFSLQPGIVAFEWDASGSPDLKDYRIQIANNEGMTNATEYTTTDARFVYYAGIAGTTYFARVAARNQQLKSSDFTTTVTTAIGTNVASEDTASENAQVFYESTSSRQNNFFPTSSAWTTVKQTTTEALAVDITVPDDGTWALLIWSNLVTEFDNSDKASLQARLVENGLQVGTVDGSTHADLATGRYVGASPFFFRPIAVNGESYQYTIQGSILGAAGASDLITAAIGVLLIRLSS
jgi:hypothetical protein